MNFYLIYGLEYYLIDEKIKEIMKNNNLTNDNIIRYNLDEDSIFSFLVEASTVSMFSDKKLIICDNSSFLSANKSISDEELNELNKYISNPFPDVYIVFIVNSEKLDQRKKITKELIKVSKVYDCNKIDSYNLNSYITNYIKDSGYGISSSSVELIISKVGLDLSNIMKELEKLFIYKGNDKKITKEDIEDVITNNLENNIFNLVNSIVNKDSSKIMKYYNDLIKVGEDPIKILITLSNQFRLIISVKMMRKSGYSEQEIISTLKEHPYRIKLAMNNNYSIEDIKKIMIRLSELDYDIVTGKKDKFFGMEMFLLNV